MSIEDWCQTQQADPTLSLVISILWDGTLGQQLSKQTDTPELIQFLQEWSHLCLRKGVLYRTARPSESKETTFQLVLPAAHRETFLRGCHDEVGHLGLEQMLDLMCYQFYWPHMAAQAKAHMDKYCPALPLKAKQPKAPLENIVAMHPLELVHLELPVPETWERPGRECSSGDRPLFPICPSLHNKTQTAQTTAKALWDNFIIHYGLP